MIDLTTLLLRVSGKAGLRIGRVSNTLSYRRSHVLKDLRVNVVLDVGANQGQYSRELRRSGYSGRVVSFEPLSAPFLELQRYVAGSSNHKCSQMALGNSDGTASIYVSENTFSSSLLPIRGESVKACPSSVCVGVETIQLRRLDSVRSDILQPSDRVHLKLDTQGTEADVLLGARETLDQVVTIELEMSLAPLYENQLLMPQMFEMLRELGFRCVWIERAFTDPVSGHALQVDGLILRREADKNAS